MGRWPAQTFSSSDRGEPLSLKAPPQGPWTPFIGVTDPRPQGFAKVVVQTGQGSCPENTSLPDFRVTSHTKELQVALRGVRLLNGQPWGYSKEEERLCLLWGHRNGRGAKKWVISQNTMPAVSLLSTSVYISKAQDVAHQSPFLLEKYLTCAGIISHSPLQ